MGLKKCTLIILLSLAPFIISFAAGPGNVEVKDGWFYVNGEKYFVKGTCYFEHHSIDGVYKDSTNDVTDHELKQIREANFNTIRSVLNTARLEIAKKYGIMVWQGAAFLCFTDRFNDENLIYDNMKFLKATTSENKNFDNILMYGIGNEPNPMAMFEAGEDVFYPFYQKFVDKLKEIKPDAVTSLAAMPPIAFFDHRMYGCVTLNLYPFFPASGVMSYYHYAKWYKNKYAKNKPFIISEYGMTIDRDEKDLAGKMMELLDMQIRAGAAGSFYFTWRAFDKEGFRDSSWYGIIPNNGEKNSHKNKPRDVYYAFKKYFEAVIIEPKQKEIYEKLPKIEVYGTDNTSYMEAEFLGKTFKLKKSGRYWWKGSIPNKNTSFGRKALIIRSYDNEKNLLIEKVQKFYYVQDKKVLKTEIAGSPESIKSGETYKVKVLLKSQNGQRVKNHKIKVGINFTKDMWRKSGLTVYTDENGEYEFKYRKTVPGYLFFMTCPYSDDETIELIPDIAIVEVLE